MFAGQSREEWVRQYSRSHQHPVNRFCHTVGIPMVAGSIALIIIAVWVAPLRPWAWSLFVIGWIFQFVGHWVEGKPPEFFRDWRFLFVGLSWWYAKVRGKA